MQPSDGVSGTLLQSSTRHVTVKIDGLAASAASVIAVAGDTVQVSPVAMMMIHNPATMAIGNTKDMEAAIAMLNEVKESILNAYVDKTGLSRNKLSKLMDDETWFNAKKAVELGFADEILFSKEEKAPAKKKPDEGEDPEEGKEDGDDDEKEKKFPFKQQAMMFSGKHAAQSFMNKVSVVKPQNQVPVDQLQKRLNLLRH